MHTIQIADQMFIAASAHDVSTLVSDHRHWHYWWPDLSLRVVDDRGEKGIRWKVIGIPITGTMEVWLEPLLDGVLMHYFLHAEPTHSSNDHPPMSRYKIDTLNHHYRVKGKRMAFGIKNFLERHRLPGTASTSHYTP